MSSDEDADYCFGQREPPLVEYVKQILRNYTEGQLLKELTQNADDAGATTVRFLYDGRQHGTENLYCGKGIGDLSPYQGPALCSFNDATFMDKDWTSIQNLSRSEKKDDPTKVGRFGMGFVSVYHVTDVPSILSGNYLALMDPTETLFTYKGKARRGRQLDIHKRASIFKDPKFTDQFQPYKNLFSNQPGLIEGHSFMGAMFRFPLRRKPSLVSDNMVNGDDVKRLFKLFVDDAKILLLFLKTINSITVGEKLTETEVPLFSANISCRTKDIVQKSRKDIITAIKSSKPLHSNDYASFSTIFPMHIEIVENHLKPEEHKWLISIYLEGSDNPSKLLTLAKKLDRLPLVGVAMQAFSAKNCIEASSPLEGRTCCFLPLPPSENYSGLPVHVNADFGISDDRRTIKWPVKDRNDKMSKWNTLLLQQLFPKAYTQLILHAIEQYSTGEVSVDCIYKTWPDVNKVEFPWKELMCPNFFNILLEKDVFFSEIGGGKWINIDEAIFDHFEDIPKGTQQLIVRLLLENNVPIVSTRDYPHVMNAVLWHCTEHEMNSVTPSRVRDTLRNVSLCSLARREKICLLTYLLADNDFDDLHGFELLPLADSSFCRFASKTLTDDEVVYFSVLHECSMDLLPGLRSRFLDENIEKSLKDKIIRGSQMTGINQVQQLKPNMIATLIRDALPSDWSKSAEVMWYPGHPDHPPRCWLKKFWSFLQEVSKNDISKYEGITLIPTRFSEDQTEVKLIQLVRKSNIVVIDGHQDVETRLVEAILPSLHLITVNLENAEFVKFFRQDIWKTYLHSLEPNDILRIFAEAGTDESLQNDVKSLPPEDVQLFRRFLGNIQSLKDDRQRNVLLRIPVFEEATHVLDYNYSIFQSAVVNDKELRIVNKEELPDFPTEEIFLDILDTDSNNLASKLGLQTCPREEVLCQMVRCLSNEDGNVTSLIIWIMDRWDEFKPSRRKIIIDTIKKEPFVPLPDGSHRRPSECFDPSDELLAQLFSECLDVFPTSPFGIKYRSILLQLGLKTRSKLTKHDVQRCAEDVTSNSNVKKGKALLKLLNENLNFLTYSTLLDYLLNNRWVPVEDEIDQQIYPSELPRFYGCESLLKPNEATSVSLAPLVGSTMPLVSNKYPKLSNRFNWEAHPQSDKIYNHLQNIVDFVSSCQKNIDNKLDIPSLEKTLHSVYKFMQNNMEDFAQFKERDDKWVWTGMCFVAPSQISLKKTRHSFEPYSFVLQPRFSKYKHLFRAFGAIEKVDEKMDPMLELLEEIKQFHETPGNTDVTSERIEHDRDLAIYVIEGIIDINKGKVTDEIRDRIFLPLQNSDCLQFASCNDVCYPNEEWLEFDEFEDIKLVHEKVSRKIYLCLDVMPLGQKISGAMSLLGFQQAGQKEDLTLKLRNILDSGYTEDSIANEMIQNADDAGASEVRFMIDMRKNNSLKTRLLDKGMKSWQGPALWVYNDSTFSDEDFENITKIGGRTKGSNPELIGKFGLGFNSVYHITDVPSFLSRGLVGFLDPHTNFLDSQLRDKRNPGIRIDLNQSKTTLKRFCNQFQPFHGIFGCNLFDTKKVQFDGTLFRLPLRTMAIKSQISDKHFEEDDVLHLMENVNKNAEKLLLFTQHVTKVSVYYLGKHSEPQHAVQLFSATKTPKEYIKEINNSIKYLGDMDKFKMQNCILLESSKFLSSGLELKNTSHFPSSLTRLSVEHCLTKEGALYYRTDFAKCTSTQWLVFSCMGQSNSLELYKSDTSRFKIPCGGIALPLLSQPIQGEVFSFLPLSIPTSGIPCHINGNFEVSNDRRNLWRRGTITGVRDLKSDWNDAIFVDIINRSYVSLLSHKQAQCCLTAFSTYDLWPNESQIPVKSEYLPLLKAFYRAIVYGIDDSGDKPCIFQKHDKWLNIDAIFIYKPYTQAVADDVKAVLQRFISPGKYVVDIPDKVIKGFERAGCGDAIHKRMYTEERFFEEVFFPNINYMESETRDKLTMHVIDNYKRPSYKNLLENTACIPTGSASEPLKRVSDLVHPYGKVSDLFEPEELRFPNKNYRCDETRLEVLVKLGMVKDDLSLSELLERARVLEGFKCKRKRKMNKIQCFMKFLETKSGLINQKFMNDIRCVKILPVSKKPVNFPADFPWYGDECDDFLCAAELHPFAYSNLVCFVKPVVNEQVFRWCRDAENVSRIFNLSKQMRSPSCLEVTQQLRKLSDISNDYLLANEAMVLKMCNIIYAVLEREVDCNKELSDKLQTDDWAWVWHGEGFTCKSSVCINKGTVNLKPYFYSVHQSLRCYKQLFIHCNVPQEQSERLSDLIGILYKIKNKHDGDISPLATDIERDRNLVIEILTFIKGHCNEDIMKERGQDILIPIECKEELRLVRPEECCFCDDWFKSSLTSEHDENLVHQDVTNSIAAFFGVTPLSRKLSHSYEIGITHFGQEEALTQRLHNVLEDYQDVDIPKEMIQNADDAMATEVKFLIDLSKNSSTNGLLDIGMSLCHGPALCVFNNAMFTEDDFENITKLGGQTKRQEKEKIGNFGLGFNSVYHLTDVPSFISNGRLTIFDPHRFHLGNQIRFGAPGIQINFNNDKKILDRFHNQFRPYENIFGCDLRGNSFTGTLFRLPLRTDEQVRKGGKISKNTFSKTKIRDLIKRFLKQAGEMLIFTKHVQKMSIYRRSNYDEQPICICSVMKEPITESRNGNTSKIRINVQYPNGGCQYFQLKGKQEDWIIHTVNGTNESSQIAKSSEGVKHGLSTCGGLAYKYHSTEMVSGLVFCFLPLSIPPSGLPIHINAKFSVTSDRRSLRKKGSGDDTTIHSEWNNALMKDVIARAYITLLSEPTPRTMVFTDVSTIRKKDGLFSLWPRTDRVHTDILHVVHSFYKAVVHGINHEAKSNLPQIFNVDQNWLTFDEIHFFDADLTDCQIVTVVTDIMVRQGLVIVDLPDYILKSFIDSHCFDEIMTRTVSFQQFFEVYFFPKISEFPDDVVNVTLLYLLQHNDFDWIDDMLKSTPCIPSTPDGARKIPSELIDHTCHLIASMYLPNDGKFALGNEFRTPEILVKLRSLGMAHLSIPLDHVVERCQSVELLHQISDSHKSTKICRERANAILKYIDSIKTDDKGVKKGLLELHNIKFIPTETESPLHYPVLWANTKDVFLSPKCVYSSELKEYVGAVAPLARDLKCTLSTKRLIKIKITPDLTDVIKQLKQLISIDCIDITRIHHMYMLLITEIQKHIKTKKVAIIKESLQNLPVVLCSGKFVKIDQVSLTCNREFQPYLYKLPPELKTCVDFFKILGLEENFHPSTLLNVSYLLQSKYEEKALSDKDMQVAIDLVLTLAACKDFDDERQILIPDSQMRLRPVSELSFCLHDSSDDDIKGETLCHNLIPHELADKLGVKDIRLNILSKNRHKLKYGTKFGQVQKLTSRISEILEGYPCDDSIFKELLQNADDAGADEINFIYDPRQHPDEKVFCESWKQTLGPALCVFNNKPFTESDLKGIQDLGIGSKSAHPDKTGQYGIGFNSVYHLTDCPTFLSNDDTLCVFDPRCAYIDDATADAPGSRYDISQELNKLFSDALSCFRLDSLPNRGCTMFRFPLRTTKMSYHAKDQDSVMSRELYDGKKLPYLLDTFKNNAFDMLLYLNNLKKITISHIDEISHCMETEYVVEAELSEEDEEKRRKFYKYVKECANKSKLEDIKIKEVTYEMKISDSRGKTEVWLVNQRIGSSENIPLKLSSAYNEGYLNLLPRGGVAARLLGSQKMCCAYCFLPLPIFPKLPVSVNGHFSLDSTRRNLSNTSQNSDWNLYIMSEVISCSYSQLLRHLRDRKFGPLSGCESLITCKSSCLHDMMELYWNYFPNLSDVHTEWKHLAEHVFLNVIRNQIPLFPVVRRTDDVIAYDLDDCTDNEYRLEWLPAAGAAGKKVYFDTETRTSTFQRQLSDKEKKKIHLKAILQHIGFTITSAPKHIYEDLTTAGKMLSTSIENELQPSEAVKCQLYEIELVTPNTVVYFLKTGFNPGTLPCSVSMSRLKSESNYFALLEYVDKDKLLKDGKIPLDGLPLLLTQDSWLRKFNSTDTYFCSRKYALLPKCWHEFVHQSAQSHFSETSMQIKCLGINHLVERLNMNIGSQYNINYKVTWNPNSDSIPNKAWLQKLWDFLKEEFDKRSLNKHQYDNGHAHIKSLMGNWTVFPVKVKSGPHKECHYLIPFSSAELVIHSNIADSYIKEALAKMELPVVDETIFGKERFSYMGSASQNSIIDFIKQFIATASTPARLLTSLVSLLDENDQAFEVLDSENKKNILLFFVRFIGSSLNEQHSDDLRKLPCYLSIHKTYITLSNKKQYFVLHAYIPKVEREKWVADSKAEFISDDSSLNKLHALLGLTKSTELDVYREFILPSFCKFTHEARVEHLQRIQTLLSLLCVKQKRDNLISNMGLKTTPLISHKDGPIKRIGEFYDSSIPLFRCMLKPEMFLPKPLCEYHWKDFMKELGLITKPTPMKILEFARAIEQGMVLNELDPQTEKSKMLIRHISNSDELMKNTNLIRDLSDISFLAPHPLHHDLVALHEPYKLYSDGRLGIPYKGALTSSNEHLVWTSANLLPEYAVPHIYGKRLQFNDLLPNLNANVTPSVDNVLVHIKNICTNLKDEYGQSKRSSGGVKSVECRKLLNRVLDNIYRFLCEKREESDKIQKELKNEPIMLVDEDQRLSKAEFTVKTIKAGLVLKPYIYQIPECFVQYMVLFSRLGAQEKPSIWQCCELLTMIHADIKDDSFRDNPNLKRMVKFSVRKIFKSYLEKDWLSGRTTLYLPNRSCQLVKSNSLKYYDKPMFEVRLKEENTNILINFKEIELKNDATVYIQKMPRELQPCKFSKSIQEAMSLIPDENKCCFAKEGACKQLNIIRRQIHSAEFRNGIYRLMKHEAYQNGVELPETVLPSVPELTRDHLSIQCLKRLETHLVEADIIIKDSKMEEDCLLVDAEKTIYIRHQSSGDYGFLKLMLANIISKLTGEIINDVMTIQMMIFCNLKQIQTKLSKHNIRELDACTSESMSLPDLGSQLPDYIVGSLDNDPFNEFTPGEYVVYELCEAGNEVYVYAMILRRINDKYEINFGRDNNKVVSAFDLYKWVPSKSNTDRNHDEEMALQAMVDVSANSNSEQSSKTHPKRASTPPVSENLEETKDKVSDNLEEIWKLDTEERKKAVKRLYLKWHPDKNPGREEFCSEVFKHLKNEIDRLEKGLPRQRTGEEPTGKYYNSEDADSWEGYYKEWNRRARRDKRRREHRYDYTWRENFRSGASFSWTDTDFSFTNPPPPRSMPVQAKLWQKQAREDLRAADNDIDGYPSYEWVAYKCLRAVEKSLKAAILSSKGVYDKDDNIRLLSMTVSDLPGCPDDIRKHVDELCANGKDQNRAQYPGRFDDEIPHELFDRNGAIKCISTAKIILDMMDDVIAFQ
ncbi:sacsin-like [Anneissia japonica]|uniref:sacsin-like n=1 Tax=Anneissia japonica TaxID=1529436 RepID=UPI0014258744|nr:sacsin-like [Anneissia japonica]XP_033125965.1 sacsin-like [Anneissia japonica]